MYVCTSSSLPIPLLIDRLHQSPALIALAIVNTVAVNIGWHISFQIFLDIFLQGFPGSSTGKESMCNAGDPSLIPGFGRSPGEGICYRLQYSWASLVTQLVKNLPAIWETWVWALGWEDPLENGTATHSSILAWSFPWTEQSMGLQRVGHYWVTFTFQLYAQQWEC